MSLNGLDVPCVKEAHEAAVAEPGGWFVLKYSSRDEVELLGRGSGGIVEIRNKIAQYDENSPLYGFLRYRRRNVIFKFQPEECSRLVQARASVHFNVVCEHFSPHDTSFSIANAKELTDTKLSAACSLHAASGSTSSSTSSLRRRRLMEITEEEEDEERGRKRQSVVKEEERSSTVDGHQESDTLSPTEPPVKLDAGLASSLEASHFSLTTEPPSFTGVPPRSSSPTKSFDDEPRRMSSQSTRPDIYSSYSTGPRVRLGPRPSAELGGRPRTSAGTATYRPVSTIPAGFKVLSKGPKKDRPQEEDDNTPESPIKEEADPFPSTSTLSAEDKTTEDEAARPHTSSGASQIAVPLSPFKLDFSAMPPPPIPQKQSTMTPEKARLLKAMKLREKKKMMSLQPAPSPLIVEQPVEPSSAAIPSPIPEIDAPEDAREPNETAAETDGHLESSLALSKADSGIGVDVSGDQASVDTHIDSNPTSPIAISDIGDSTQASSISESTDETVLAAKDGSVAADSAIGSPSLSGNEDELTEEPVAGQSADIDTVESKDPEEEEPQSTPEENQSREMLAEEVQEKDFAPEVASVAAKVASPVDVEDQSPVKSAKEETAELPQIRIPVSKFSTQESKSPTSASSQNIPSIVVPSPDVDNEAVPNFKAVVKDEQIKNGDAAGTAPAESKRLKSASTLEPIMTGLGHRGRNQRMSVTSLSDDDRLMDELQSATVQQAKPITVSKSPINPFFPSDISLKRSNTGREGSSTGPRMVRTVSSPARGPLLAPADVLVKSARSASSGSAFLNKMAQQQAAADLRPKSAKIGSSISQRIKALQELSGAPAAPEVVQKERPSSTFFSVRKTSVREPSRSPSVVNRASSLTRKPSSPPVSAESSPETTKRPARDRTGSMVSRLSMFEGGAMPRGRPESIQVTARIVRDPNQPFPKVFDQKADPGDFSPLELKQSHLLVDVQKLAGTSPILIETPPEQEAPPQRKPSLLQRRFSKGRRSESHDRNGESSKEEDKDDLGVGRPRRRSSMTIVRDFIKDRRDSIRGAKSPSTDNLSLNISSGQANLASPALTTSSRSPSRPPSTHHTSVFPRRLSISSRRSSIEQKSPAPIPNGLANAFLPSHTAETSGEDEAESKVEKKRTGSVSSGSGSNVGSAATSPTASKNNNSSRATRFMRRLSSSLGSSRKNITPSISPTVTEEEDAEVEAAGVDMSILGGNRATGPPVIIEYMGDVNVQFPDNLLWKRRTMCLDSQGFVILSAVQGTAAAIPTAILGKDRHHQAGAIKRYHMSDFKMPFTPEIEVQELPNSVVLDFVDGSGLQIACEDRAGQMNVLHILEEAHRSHTSFGL